MALSKRNPDLTLVGVAGLPLAVPLAICFFKGNGLGQATGEEHP